MISVLIPTYNYNAYNLVAEIHRQFIKSNIKFEIICLDDGSYSKENILNEKINTLSYSKFEILQDNIGRSAIRNLLAKKANFNWLLFLDADVIPVKSDFITTYFKQISKKNNVFCGGIAYENHTKNKKYLRYKYGKKHEEVALEERIKEPLKYFFTGNFFIAKKVFEKVKFEEKLLEYGKEDLLFSVSLLEKKLSINHIKNEVFHLGIDDNKIFIAKTKKAMDNLVFLGKEGFLENEKQRLLAFVDLLTRLKLNYLLIKLYPFFERKAEKLSSVRYLNLLKVSYICFLKRKENPQK
ncbi:Glycosyltransferase involved in cell wall bisynthesis [Polaribacter sp. KT25b]|uniref:glycosyltransferase family 2 protein n=1 Tax=Polaribacter sp. KT25b TaxID=1855336 RepID=UPI00087CE072|nr:glycosyltransferase family A protein [Polaribacter sp. KT25b]SDR72520.1 Glycosyltransferase involved in cell wall bisynthesis [Polaribacter sp. KT25b]